MLPPGQDLEDRVPVWDALQMFWMDTDPAQFLEDAARVSARSKFTLEELEQIFWNEVRPAVSFNLGSIAGEWTGFEIGWLTNRILETHQYGQRLPFQALHPESGRCWNLLSTEIRRLRAE